jgi:hypothetical protein
MVSQDNAGRWWAKSTSTGEWYYHDGNDWVLGSPPNSGTVTQDLQSTYEQRHCRKRKEVLGAIAVVFAGVTWVVFNLVRWVLPAAFPFESPSFYLQEGTTLLELSGTLVGLLGLYIRQAASYGRLGTIGLSMTSTGVMYLLVLNENLLFTLNTPSWMLSPLVVLAAQLARSLGFVLLGVSFLRARVLPRWMGLAFVAGGVVTTIAPLSAGYLPRLVDPLFLLVFWPVWLALGYALWPKMSEADYPPTRTS